MAKYLKPEIGDLSFTVRFIQGYRYLDKTGEALVRIEESLDEHWIPGEISPARGVIRNFKLGLTAEFKSESLTVQQTEFISMEHFQDQTCKLFEVLCDTFEIEKILAPVLRAIVRVKCDTFEEAERHIAASGYVIPSSKIADVFDGELKSLHTTMIAEAKFEWNKIAVSSRQRMASRTIKQESQPTFDDRLATRIELLPPNHRDAIAALNALRRKHSAVPAIAAEYDIEYSFSDDFRRSTFPLDTFFSDAWKWIEKFRTRLPTEAGIH